MSQGTPARTARLIIAVVAVAGLATDVVTKWLALTYLDPARPVPLLGGVLTLRLVRNPGAAFSIGEGFTPVFAVLAFAALVVVAGWMAPRVRHRGWAWATGLLLAGVAGNFLDRLIREPGVLHGHVVDFLQLPHWPIFNVADMCIDAAAVLVVWYGIVTQVGLDGSKTPRRTKTDAGAGSASAG